MKRKVSSSLFVAAVSFVAMQNDGSAVDFGNNFYGKANVAASIRYQRVGSQQNYGGIYGVVGFDVFAKVHERINPFVGVNVGGGSLIGLDDGVKFNQFLNVNFRVGASLKVCKSLKVNPYGLVGFNYSQLKITDTEDVYGEDDEGNEYRLGDIEVSQKESKIGMNAGAGVDLVINDRFLVGVEYQRSEVKLFGEKVKSDNVGVKFGVEFL